MNTKAVDMLTQEQIAKVASEVTGCQYTVWGTSVKWIRCPENKPDWCPSFTAGAMTRSQAFAMVEWLLNWSRKAYEDAEHLERLDGFRFRLEFAVTSQDIDALHQMIWELME